MKKIIVIIFLFFQCISLQAQDMQSIFKQGNQSQKFDDCSNGIVCSILNDFIEKKYESAFRKLNECAAKTLQIKEGFFTLTVGYFTQPWCVKNLVAFHKYGLGVPASQAEAMKAYDNTLMVIKALRDDIRTNKIIPAMGFELSEHLDRYNAEIDFEIADMVLNLSSQNDEDILNATRLLAQSANFGYPKAVALRSLILLKNQEPKNKDYTQLVTSIKNLRKQIYFDTEKRYVDKVLIDAQKIMERDEEKLLQSCKNDTAQPVASNTFSCTKRRTQTSGVQSCDVYSNTNICFLKVNDGNCSFSSSEFSMQQLNRIVSKQNYITGDKFEFFLPGCNVLTLEIRTRNGSQSVRF
jgi:hypothetical protein